jgi:membrane-associated protease RseP (regulator of RpoE activity)
MMQSVRRLTWSLGALVCALGLATAPIARAAETDRDNTSWLGVYTQRLTSSLREGIDYRGDGVLVNRVVSDSPADRAGIEQGDVIVSVNTRTTRSPDELATIVRGSRPGQTVRVTVVRDRQRKTMDVRLGSTSDSKAQDEVRRGDSDDSDEGVPEPPDSPEVRDAPEAPQPPEPPVPYEMHDHTFEIPEGNVFLRGMGRGRLGVRIEDLNGDLGEYFGVKDGKGALIVEVLKETPAEKAGLKAGDVITAVGDQAVADGSDLVKALADEDGTVSLHVVRKSGARTIPVVLEKATRTAYRFRSGTGPYSMREWGGPGMQQWSTPDKRIQIVRPGDGSDSQELRDQVRELRDQVRELREKLDQMHHD